MAIKIDFGKISYHNFMSFADQEWDFNSDGDIFLISGKNRDLRVDDSGICASNGSGKTNLVQGLMYCLYGQFPYKIHNTNIVNKYSKATDAEGYIMRVSLDFTISDEAKRKRSYKIVRGIQKGATGSVRLNLYERREETGEYEDVSKSSSANTQAFIESVLGMGFQSFQRLVMLSFDPAFNFFRMTAAQKREFIQALFDTGVYTNMWELIKKDQSRFSMSLQSERVRLNTIQSQLSNCENEIRQYASSAKEQESVIGEQIDSLKRKIVELQREQKKSEEVIETLKKDLASVDTQNEKYSDVVSKIRYRIYTTNQTISMIDGKIASYRKEIDKHNNILGLVCDDCRGKIRDAYNLDEYEKGIRESESSKSNSEEELTKLNEALNQVNTEARKATDEKMRLESQVRTHDSTLTGLRLEEREAETKIELLKRRKEEIANSINDPKQIPMMGTYVSLKKDVSDCESSVKRCETDVYYLNLCEKAVCPETIRKNIVSRVVSNINDLVNRYLDEFNITIRCEFDDQLDKFTISAPQGWSIDYQNLSKGEQMKLLLATQLAFRKFLLLRLNTTCNCFILDEIVDQNFDTLSISRILDVLLGMSELEKTHIYIISHRSEVSRLTDDLVEARPEMGASVQRILIEKVNNISKVTLI